MAARLTDRQKKRIIADYVETGSYNAVAKKHGVCRDTVKRLVLQNGEIRQKLQQKKEKNTLDMLDYMDSKKEEAQNVLDLCLKALADPSKLEKASLREIATAFGIVADKFSRGAADQHGGVEDLAALADLLKPKQ